VLVLTVALTLLAIGVGVWWLVVRQSPLNSATSQPCRCLRRRGFIPAPAPLSLHLLTILMGWWPYTRVMAFQQRQRRRAVAAVEAPGVMAPFAAAGTGLRQ